MTPITIEQYAGPYLDHADFTPAKRDNAGRLLVVVNGALDIYERDGGQLYIDRDTGCYIAGNGNGGFRPMACPVGAPSSTHKQGLGIDIYDPNRELAAWCVANESVLRHLGIYGMEDPRWTPTWVHWQLVEVASHRFFFIPSRDKALVGPVPGQVVA